MSLLWKASMARERKLQWKTPTWLTHHALLEDSNCHRLCFISPFNRGNLDLSRGLCGRLLHAIFSQRTRSGSSLSLNGKVRGLRMTTDRSGSCVLHPASRSFVSASRALVLSDSGVEILQVRHVDWQGTAIWTCRSREFSEQRWWSHRTECAACLTWASLLL